MEREQLRAMLSPYLDGELTPEERAAFEQHLETDDELRADLEASRQADALFRALPHEPAPDAFAAGLRAKLAQDESGRPAGNVVPFRRRFLPLATAAAAAVLCIAGGGYVLMQRAGLPEAQRMRVSRLEAPPAIGDAILSPAPAATPEQTAVAAGDDIHEQLAALGYVSAEDTAAAAPPPAPAPAEQDAAASESVAMDTLAPLPKDGVSAKAETAPIANEAESGGGPAPPAPEEAKGLIASDRHLQPSPAPPAPEEADEWSMNREVDRVSADLSIAAEDKESYYHVEADPEPEPQIARDTIQSRVDTLETRLRQAPRDAAVAASGNPFSSPVEAAPQETPGAVAQYSDAISTPASPPPAARAPVAAAEAEAPVAVAKEDAAVSPPPPVTIGERVFEWRTDAWVQRGYAAQQTRPLARDDERLGRLFPDEAGRQFSAMKEAIILQIEEVWYRVPPKEE